LIKDKREEVSVAMPNQAPIDPSSNLENHIVRSNDMDTTCLQIVESDDKAEDNARELHLSELEEPRGSDPERNLSPSNLVGVKEESTKVNNSKRDCSESDISSENLLHPTASGPVEINHHKLCKHPQMRILFFLKGGVSLRLKN
jgi:hypothetical protein